jgi:hypothetical protein
MEMTRPPVSWVVDTLLTDRNRGNTGFPTIAEAAHELGYPVYQTQYIPGSRAPDPGIPFGPGCVMTYGTHQFVRQASVARAKTWSPGAFSRTERLSYSAYTPYIGDLMLNDDFILLPYAEVLRRGFDAFGDAYFLKPDAVTKAFTGFVMTREKYLTEVETLKKQGIDPAMVCVVAKPRPIEAEFRFVVADREVVTGSQYRWADRSDVRLDVLPICVEMAQEVANRKWQADRCYTCDVALLNGRTTARVVELNTFSSSGLYACDTRKIVEAVSASAYREYLGED